MLKEILKLSIPFDMSIGLPRGHKCMKIISERNYFILDQCALFGSPFGSLLGSPFGSQFVSPFGSLFVSPFGSTFGSTFGSYAVHSCPSLVHRLVHSGSPFGSQFG